MPPLPPLNVPLIPSPLDGGTPTCEACSIVGVGALDPLGPSFCLGKKGRPERGQGGQSSYQILASAPQKLEEGEAGSLPLPPKCPHAQVPNDSSMSSPGGSAAINGGNCRFRGVLPTNSNERDSPKTCFHFNLLPPFCPKTCPLHLNNSRFIIE